MNIQISYHGLRLQEHLRALQATFQEGALGRVLNSPEDTLKIELIEENAAVVDSILRRAARESGFILLQDDESFYDPDTRFYQAYTPKH
ncbi:MAG TPA: hypothetical protein PLO23_04760 [Alphaproteobacteria bacterium]|nr:hypothetical protein [Alphaproteobacteria bacterium]